MSDLCMRRQMTVEYGLGVWMKFPMTRRLSIVCDLSIHNGKSGGVSTVWAQSACIFFFQSIDMCVVASDVQMIKFGRVLLLEMAHSAYLSPCDLYVAFGYTNLKNCCDPTENVPSWFDWVCNFG